ncbi:MAG: M13 family metallopeptidase [Verrucomicrobiota bacterium]|jgi:putative endopeptidase
MKKSKLLLLAAATAGALWQGCANQPMECCSVASESAAPLSPVPRFSTNYMDATVSPATNFYLYACGAWMRDNPIPPDKPSWSAFGELRERNWQLIHDILYSTIADCDATPPPPHSPLGEVAAFYASAMDSNRLEQLAFTPLRDDFARIAALKSAEEMLRLLADFQNINIPAMFGSGVSPDARNSGFYAFELGEGGLGLPDRDYYLSENLADKRDAYQKHIAKMLAMSGETEAAAQADAAKILDLETALAKACKPRQELRDPIANYHKFTVADAISKYPHLPLRAFLDAAGLGSLREVIIHQPDFFTALDTLVQERPLEDWKTYLRWHVLRAAAPCLHTAAEEESFDFYGKVLSGQLQQEPRWQRAARTIDSHIGEALGQLYVEKNFPPEARARMNDLIEDLKAVFRDHLEKVPWMTPATRARALEKFGRFTQKIGYPKKFRDYSSVELRPEDYLGNVRRSALFESKRQLARVGKAVDKTEWDMTPQTVNAYFNPNQNEIVFPAGILQPPFFDVTMDDAVNYGAIGVVIGHEMTHGYDDQGRKFDGDGNLSNWWTADDEQAFKSRAQLVVDQYDGYEALPGIHVNGQLTLGENLADLGGVTLAYDALERSLARHPERRKTIDGFTPEQRFFLSFAQVWRTEWREAELHLRLITDVHSPGQFRAVGPESNLQQFYDAFGIREGAPMWRPPSLRAVIW